MPRPMLEASAELNGRAGEGEWVLFIFWWWCCWPAEGERPRLCEGSMICMYSRSHTVGRKSRCTPAGVACRERV